MKKTIKAVMSKGIVLAGGTGSRLYPLTKISNKHLLPVYDRPMIDWAILHLREIGITDIGIVISKPHDEQVKNYLGKKFTYIHQGTAKGIGQAVLSVKNFIGNSNFIVHLGDQIYTESLLRHYKEWQNKQSDIHIILKRFKYAYKHTVVTLGENGITSIREKPKEKKEGYVMTGINFYTPKIFPVLEKLKKGKNGEYQLSDAIECARRQNFNISYSFLGGEWVDAGTPDNLLLASQVIRE